MTTVLAAATEPASRAVPIAVGVVWTSAGAFGLFVALSRSEWSAGLRAHIGHGRGPNRRPATRFTLVIFAMSWILSGLAITLFTWEDALPPDLFFRVFMATSIWPILVAGAVGLVRFLWKCWCEDRAW